MSDIKDVNEVTKEVLEKWAVESDGPVALRLKQTLLPVEESRIIFPPYLRRHRLQHRHAFGWNASRDHRQRGVAGQPS